MFDNENTNYGITKGLVERIRNAILMNLQTQVKKIFTSLHPADQAELVYNLKKDERKKLIEILKRNIDPELLVQLDGDVRHEIINYLDKDILSTLLTKLNTEDVVDILEDFEDELTQDTINTIKSSEKREDIEEALSYPEDSVGRIMDQDNFIAIPKEWDVAEFIKYLRKNRNVPQEFSNIIIVDEYFKPISSASIGSILKADSKTQISTLMKNPEELKMVNADMDQSEVANLFIKYDLKFMPVVNYNGVLLGVINSNDIMHVVNEEGNEDMMLMANVNVDDTIHATVFDSVKRRLPWLVITILTASISAIIINHFSSTIQKFVILSALIPLISNLSGVSGTQTLTILVRNISNNETGKMGVLKIIGKETIIGFFNGILLSIIGGLALYLWKGDLKLCIIFSVTIITLQTVSCLIGSAVPLIINKLKMDPAVGSSTFITAALDTLSSLLLLGMVSMFLVG